MTAPLSPDGARLRPSRPRRLVFAGEAIVDVVLNVPRLPARGGDQLATASKVTAGGGFNVMAAAARQGLPVVYAGGHGTGPWGDLVRAALEAEGIGVLRPPDPDRDTGFDVALVEPDAERTFVTHLGAEAVRAWDGTGVEDGDMVYVSGYGLVVPETGAVLGGWAAGLLPGAVLFLDPGPLVGDVPAAVLDPVLARCDWLSCNLREASILTGGGDAGGDPATAARRLRTRAPRAGVLVRAGAAGCYVLLPGESDPVHLPAPVVKAVDSTGAGDAHAGAFLSALADGRDPLEAAARANAAAAFAVTRPGPATAPARGQLDAWLAGQASASG